MAQEITAALLAAYYRGYRTLFNQQVAETPTDWEKVAQEVPSDTEGEVYGWLKPLPSMREWLGDKTVKSLGDSGMTIVNKDWELTIELDRNKLSDNKAKLFGAVVQNLARSAAMHPDELIFKLMKEGFAELCYDGQPFFHDSHPVGEGFASNSGGGDGTPWFLLDCTRPLRPFLFQKREDVRFVALDQPTDENAFMRKKFFYSAERRDNAGYGLWQLAYASKQTLDADAYAAARTAMKAFTDDEGHPLGIGVGQKAFTLVVPTSLEGAARKILVNEFALVDEVSQSNPWRDTANLVVSPWLD